MTNLSGPLIPAEPFLKAHKKKIYDLCKQGITTPELADAVGLTVRQLERLIDKSEEIRLWVEKSREMVDMRVEGALYKQAIGYNSITTEVVTHPDGTQSTKVTDKFYPPNIAASQFWLKNRQPERWKEKPAPESAEEKPPLIIQLSTDENPALPDPIEDTS